MGGERHRPFCFIDRENKGIEKKNKAARPVWNAPQMAESRAGGGERHRPRK
jgi:hypothetical protein